MDNRDIRFIEANGLRFGYFEQGSGPLLLCLHGFPDTPHSFAHLMETLAQQGYRVVAPFMRGYYPTDPAADGDYTAAALAADALALIDALGESEAVLLGHDWGCFAAYCAANLAPNKVSKLVLASAPHLHKLPMPLVQLRMSWYVLFFQLPWLPERSVAKDHFAFIDRLYRDWSPNWMAAARSTQEIKRCLSAPGALAAAIGYYRCMIRKMGKSLWQLMSRQTTVPTIVFAGGADGSISPELYRDIEACFTQFHGLQVLPGVGHFPQREMPEEFAKRILAFLQS